MEIETLIFENGVEITREVLGPDPLDEAWIVERYRTRDAAGVVMHQFYRRIPAMVLGDG